MADILQPLLHLPRRPLVIYTSGYDTQNLAQSLSLKEGVNFIQKPFHARKLAETVYDCLNSKPAAR